MFIASNDANDNQSLENQLQSTSTGNGSSGNDETGRGVRQVDESRDGSTDRSGDGRENGMDRDTESVLPSTAADIRLLADGPLARKEDRPQQLTGDNPGNFVIADNFDLGSGTDGQKISGNLNAIRTLRLVQNEQRYPTTDEQAIMALYVGWGGFSKVFDSSKADATDQYGKAQHEIKTLLSPEEYAAANASIRNAHYTAQGIVDGVWRVMRFMGFKGGRRWSLPLESVTSLDGCQMTWLHQSSGMHPSWIRLQANLLQCFTQKQTFWLVLGLKMRHLLMVPLIYL